ncbi:hypothetical protein BN903_19 [Halorubrum sp. AJ67]|nr:hypothetical protein BN903_19 [Halorubrum sp. AJ67]
MLLGRIAAEQARATALKFSRSITTSPILSDWGNNAIAPEGFQQIRPRPDH